MALSTTAVEPTTFVLLNPTDPDGESALQQLRDIDTHITLVVLLWDDGGAALRDYAQSENIDLATAGLAYLEQVARTLDRPRGSIAYHIVNGSRPALELAMLEHTHTTRRVLLPNKHGGRATEPPRTSKVQTLGSTSPAQRLLETPLGRKTPAKEIRHLDRIGTLIHLDPRTQLVRQGANPGGACVLVEGTAMVERDGLWVANLSPGEFVGEISLISGTRCNADVVTTEPAVVLEFTPPEFSQVLDDCPVVAKHLLRASVERLLAA